jgi:NodT family efflux transporter outer membrane factor (OMF) lipoprotein
MTSLLKSISLVLLAALAGCTAMGDTYQRPELAVPVNWLGRPVPADTAAWPEREWWKGFGDAELDRYMAEAEAGNYDLQAAVARVAQARANRQIAAAALYPELTLDAGASRVKAAGGSSASAYSVAGQVAYEVDLWGRNRAGVDSADASLLASAFDRETVRLVLTADVATSYFQILSFNDRIRTARENLASAERLMQLIDAQKAAGKVSALEVETQRTEVASARADILPLLQGRRVAQDTLALLLGRPPGALPQTEASLRPTAAPAVPLGLPSQLLERRPDIRRAEANLVAAHADIAAARAALFPTVSLSARGGFAAATVGSLFDGGTGFYSLGLDLLATLFDGGRLSGQVDFARGRQAELVADYRRSVLTALAEVEDALSGVEQFGEQEKAQQEVVAHARESYRLAELRYREGASDFLTVVIAQRALIRAEAALDPVRFSRFSSMIGLYRALGGGWQDIPPAAAAAVQ